MNFQEFQFKIRRKNNRGTEKRIEIKYYIR